MVRGISLALPLVLLIALPSLAVAQSSSAETQQLGQQLVTQSCGVCHFKPLINAARFGPALSKESAGGNPDVMRDVITNGTPRMPAFKYLFEPRQIEAIVAYLQTVPAPPPEKPASPAR